MYIDEQSPVQKNTKKQQQYSNQLIKSKKNKSTVTPFKQLLIQHYTS